MRAQGMKCFHFPVSNSWEMPKCVLCKTFAVDQSIYTTITSITFDPVYSSVTLQWYTLNGIVKYCQVLSVTMGRGIDEISQKSQICCNLQMKICDNGYFHWKGSTLIIYAKIYIYFFKLSLSSWGGEDRCSVTQSFLYMFSYYSVSKELNRSYTSF